MEVRGSVVQNISTYVESFHADGYEKWKNTLSKESQELANRTSTSKWYPVNEGILETTQAMCDLCYTNPVERAWKSGRFSAEVSLTGIYKVFVIISQPVFLIKKGITCLSHFLLPHRGKCSR